ncbi:MAG: DMT family transporter [Alphaproteobacteria bacterium]|nr:DMT family transporter [Alphaproteobacteria bacterium]
MQSSAALRGVAWMVASGFVYSMSTGIVRYLADYMTPAEIVFWRSVTGLAVMLPWAIRAGGAALKTSAWSLLGLRSIASYLGMLCSFYAYSKIAIADAVALQFTLPLFTILLAGVLLGERIGRHGFLACVIGFVGALVIVRPGFETVTLATIAALGAAVFYACTNVVIKLLSRSVSTYAMTFYINVMVLPLALPLTVYLWSGLSWAIVPWIVAFGAINTVAQICLTNAIRAADARIVQPFDFLRLPFGAAIGYLAFDQTADVLTFVGAAIICAAAYYALLREGRAPA